MPLIKDRFGEKIKTNVLVNEVKEVKAWIKDKQLKEGKRYEFIPRDVLYTTLHRKGQWVNPNKISILNEKRTKADWDPDWQNREQLPAIDQQRVQLQKLMDNPGQEIRFRTSKHAERDTKLYTPRVFRNEGGNLMSSIAGAGCNKFHEFRQIRRNDRDREKFFTYLREKEKSDNIVKAHYQAIQAANQAKLDRNRRKRARGSLNTMRNRKAKSDMNKIKNIEIALNKEASKSSGDKKQKIIEEINQEKEDEGGQEYDPDDSYDEDEDDGLPPPEIRAKIAKSTKK